MQNVCFSQVLSDLLADLDACDLQKGETKVLANGEVATGELFFINQSGKNNLFCFCNNLLNPKFLTVSVWLTDKKTVIRSRIRQMMDVSRVRPAQLVFLIIIVVNTH